MYTLRNILVYIINIVFTVVGLFLLFRLLLKLFSASTGASFVQWIYSVTEPLIAPFEGIFPTVIESGVVVEFSTLFAIVIYAIAGYLLIELVNVLGVAADSRRHDRHYRE